MRFGTDLSLRRGRAGENLILSRSPLLEAASAVLDKLLTPGTATQTADPRLYKSFIILHLVGPLFGLPICAALLLLDEQGGIIGLGFTAGVCLFWLLPLLARRTSSLDKAAFVSVQLLTLVSFFGSYFYGGVNSPFAVWLIVAVLLSFLYVPRALGWCHCSMVVQLSLFLGALHYYAPGARLGQPALGALFLSSSFAAALYVSLIAVFYARIKIEGSELAAIAGRYEDTARHSRASITILEAENHRASDFMGKVSHELRTALDVVIGYSELLLDEAVVEERAGDQHHLERITASSRITLALIADGDRLVEDAPAQASTSAAASGGHHFEPEPGRIQRRARGLMSLPAFDKRSHWSLPLCATAIGVTVLIGETGGVDAELRAQPLLLAATMLILGAAALVWKRVFFGRTSRAIGSSARDELTGLLNRASFRHELECRLGGAVNTEAALLFADLDGFKEVNDSLGHDVGDQLLARVAERFARLKPRGALLARLGGDEFGAAMFGDGAEAAIRDLADAMLNAVVEPIRTEEHHLTIGVSIGVAHGKAGLITGRELLRQSDVAMYRAKHDKRFPIQTFDIQMDEALNFKRTMRADLGDALAGDQLDLHLQPVVDARSGELASLEALLRWTHPLLGPVSPAKLIRLAEDSGQITSIDDWVLERALEYTKRLPAVPVAINISPVQFRHPEFARKIVDRLSAHSVPAQLLRLEITEGVLVTHTRAANRAIAELREAGVKVALDDFGTGFSSLSYLKDFGFDFLKIDRSFVTALDAGRQGVELLRAIVELGHSLTMGVIAEGVETASQAALIQLLGCDYIQGYFTGRPMSLNALESWLAEKGEPLLGTAPTNPRSNPDRVAH